MSPPENSPSGQQPHSVAVELAELRGALNTGLATINGQLALLVERGKQTDQDLRELGERTSNDAKALGTRVDSLAGRVRVVEQKVWFACGVAAAAGSVAGIVVPLLIN